MNSVQDRWWDAPMRFSPSGDKVLGTCHIVAQEGSWIKMMS